MEEMINPAANIATSQQPLSLMTINANPNRKEDLLVIRILEASERKMQLIKRLLTPEQFSTIQFDEFNPNDDDDDLRSKLDNDRQQQLNGARSLVDQITEAKGQPHSAAEIKRAKSLSGLGKSIGASFPPPAKASNELHINLAKKREALDFFFNEQTSFPDKPDNNLAIELRSGYYLGSAPQETGSSKLLKDEPFSLIDRLIGFLGFMGISYHEPASSVETTEGEEQFEKMARANNIGLPYTRRRNIAAMRERLQAVDGEMNKLLVQDSLGQWVPLGPGEYLDPVELAKLHENPIVSSNRTKIDRHQHQVKVVEPVGHFNLIHLFGPRKFIPSIQQVDLILREPSPRTHWLLGHLWRGNSRQNLSKQPAAGLLATVSGSLKLNLSTLQITNHRLMLAEERAALRLVELVAMDRSLGGRKEQLLIELAKYVELYDASRQTEPERLDGLRKICESLTEIMKQVLMAQQEILIVYGELSSLRLEQKFNSTSIAMSTSSKSASSPSDIIVIDSMTKLINLAKAKQDNDTASGELVKFCSQFSQEYLQNNLGPREQLMSINSLGLKLTPDNECPANELERRRHVRHWLASLRLRLLIGDKYFYDCKLVSMDQTDSGLSYQINLRQHQVFVPSFGGDVENLELKIELLRPRFRLPLRLMQLEATTTTIKLPVDASQIHCVPLEFIGDDQTGSAELKFELTRLNDERNLADAQPKRCKSDQLLDMLYRSVFNMASENWLDNPETKFARLINKCDTSMLARLLGYKVSPGRRAKKFELDPFIDYLDDITSYHGHRHEKFSSTQKWAKSNRQALLVWRWVNNLPQLVYLSERENAKNYSLQLDEFKSKLEAIVVTKQETGFRSIEQARTLAVDYIKQYEAQLKEVLKFRAEERGSDQLQRSTKLKDMLREPQLRMVDLSGVVRVARSFVPRRTANRPLLPRRRRAGLASGGGNRLFLLKEAALAGDESSLPGGSSSVDMEAQQQQQNQWQRLVSSQGASRLQLVVTIQQATNVPMRVAQARPINPSTRSSSPFGPIGSPSANFMSQLMHQQQQPPSSALASPPIQYLAPPTTYVEIVFQRRQQASSLAQGKTPTWNETLFFPVDVATQSLGGATAPVGHLREPDQLVGEFLQLNLYDYNCYLQEQLDAVRPEQTHDLSTLALVSGTTNENNREQLSQNSTGDNQAAFVGAQRVQAARQRVERHLLGSMRVPLTTLMSSGRIEGSFALKQPLLLDSYQFEPEMSLGQPGTAMLGANSPLAATTAGRSPETRISLFITLDPPISMPVHLLHLPTGSHESERVLELARLWEVVAIHHRHRANGASGRSAQPGLAGTGRPFSRHSHAPNGWHRQSRHIRALVLQRDAKYCLISRLLVALEPPAELSMDLDHTKPNWRWCAMHSLARFVSLLSPLKYGLFGMRLLASSLWFDSGQLIEKSLGGPEEKAVLLCNYFLFLGIPSGLLLGESVPEGRCVHVIVWQDQSRFIEDQLQLQAANLLESISNLAGAPVNPNAGELYSQRPIERSDFISRLPILMKANSIQLFDPNSGQSYSLSNHPSVNSLVSVGSIVTMENVYANIQSVENPAETNYDIRSKNSWFPLFDSSSATSGSGSSLNALSSTLSKSLTGARQNPQMSWRRQLLQLETMRKSIGHPALGPILNPNTKLDYYKFSPEECDELKGAIERVVKSHLLKWRPDRPTYFNRTLSRLLADKLALFEGYLNNDAGDQDWRNELANFIKSEITMSHLSSSGLNTRQVISCPINMPYTGMRTIVDSIFASGVHNADLMLLESSQLQSNSPGSQFLVACHVHPYPARVVSVWLYVAAIIPNTRGFTY